MLKCLMVAHSAACHMPYPVERLLEVNEDVIEVLLVLEVLLAQYPKVEYLLCCAASLSEACLFLI